MNSCTVSLYALVLVNTCNSQRPPGKEENNAKKSLGLHARAVKPLETQVVN